MLEEKKPDDLNDAITEPMKLFAVRGRYKLIGSNALRSTQYGVDYDVETHLSSNPALSLQHAYHEAKKNPNVFVMELKCGVDPRLVYDGDYSQDSLETYLRNPLIPEGVRHEILATRDIEKRVELIRDLFVLRWTPDDVAEGRIRLIDGSHRTLHDCLMDKTTAKVDLIIKVGNQFAEMSENYYIRADGEKNYDTELSKPQQEKSLEEDIQYYAKIDRFKALKRIFSLYQLEGARKHSTEIKQLVQFFNGQVGYLNKIKCELGILIQLLDNTFRDVEWDDVRANLQFIKEQISQIYEVPMGEGIFQQIDNCTANTVKSVLVTLQDYFSKKINQESKSFLATFI